MLNPDRTIHVWRKKNAQKEMVKANVNYSNYPCFGSETNFADVARLQCSSRKETAFLAGSARYYCVTSDWLFKAYRFRGNNRQPIRLRERRGLQQAAVRLLLTTTIGDHRNIYESGHSNFWPLLVRGFLDTLVAHYR
ncbi:uncharacterized protein LOC121294627 isoform X1 [Polyodon spathula]|uniref:uncharacterized protein LOC121294627 isoform X1 n=1 Tax=Polyodon spathula TaxID=7913 RepID=UPI001B7E1FF3|nr:uncharacterized protein LOC121294627 isoform X1 [Polyodon spathula]